MHGRTGVGASSDTIISFPIYLNNAYMANQASPTSGAVHLTGIWPPCEV